MRFGDDALGARLTALLEPGELNEVVVASDLVVQAAYMEWRRTTVQRTGGDQHVRYIVGHPGAVAILAIDADRKSTRLNSSHLKLSRMPSSA